MEYHTICAHVEVKFGHINFVEINQSHWEEGHTSSVFVKIDTKLVLFYPFIWWIVQEFANWTLLKYKDAILPEKEYPL